MRYLRSRWPLVAILCVLASLLAPGIASASTATGPETRVGAFDLQDQVRVGVVRSVTRELHPGCEPTKLAVLSLAEQRLVPEGWESREQLKGLRRTRDWLMQGRQAFEGIELAEQADWVLSFPERLTAEGLGGVGLDPLTARISSEIGWALYGALKKPAQEGLAGARKGVSEWIKRKILRKGQRLANEAAGAARGATRATAHGAERLARSGFTDDLVRLTKTEGQVLRQSDGASVFLRESSPGRFDFIVEGQRGVVTAHRNWSQKAIDRIAKNYGWGQ